MRLSLITLLAASLAMSGCISNMGEFKQFLGVTKLPPPVAPPFAKASASATSALLGSPIIFSSDGTRDPQGLALSYVWSFGDGASATGPSTTHAYGKPGDFVARLVVTNARGAVDEATVTLQVLAANRVPAAAFSSSPARASLGAPVAFDASGSSDPDCDASAAASGSSAAACGGGALSYAWDFGDGATSHDAKPTHAFASAGLHVVKLTVSDPHGGSATTTGAVPVDGAWSQDGEFDVADDAVKAALPLDITGTLSSFKATLTYDAGLANDLTLVAKDGSGKEIARSAPSSNVPALGGGKAVATLSLDAPALAHAAPGGWTIEVVKTQAPAGAAWSLAVEAFA